MPQTVGWYQTVPQAKAQFSFWALMSAPLLIAADPGQVEPELIEYWGNEEIIEVSQSFRPGGPYQAARIVGGDVSFDPKTNTGQGTNVWGKLLPGNSTHAPGFALGFLNNGNSTAKVTCDSECFATMFAPPPTCRAADFEDMGDVQCLGLTNVHGVDTADGCCAACASAGCQTWQFCAKDAKCATGGASTGKTPGCFVGAISAGDRANKCSNSTDGWVSKKRTAAPPEPAMPKSIAVRDLWAHSPMPTLSPPYSFSAELDPHGGSAVYRFYPATQRREES